MSLQGLQSRVFNFTRCLLEYNRMIAKITALVLAKLVNYIFWSMPDFPASLQKLSEIFYECTT